MFDRRVRIGLDVGHYSIKAAIYAADRRRLLELREVELLPGREYIDDKPSDEQKEEAIRAILGTAAEPSPRVKPAVIAALPDEVAICRYFELPQLEKAREDTAVRTAVMKYIPYSLEDAELTYVPIAPLKEDKEMTGIFAVSVRKSMHQSLRQVIEACGASAQHFEIASLALLKQFLAYRPAPSAEYSALINVGSRLTSIIIVRGSSPYYNRSFLLGGRNFTHAFQMGHQSSWKDAEAYKRSYDAMRREIALEPVLQKWLNQVKKTLAAFEAFDKSGDAAVGEIFLTGGGASLKGLDARLQEYVETRVSFERWDRVAPGENQGGAPLASFGVALGIAL
ncbi:MAG: pilus assembly protein PilM [Candidatus Eremiobacteraeota bacterium]|nr:pilus assembly protein PilM [Candidatus Eremiobacteraeota bacterium]